MTAVAAKPPYDSVRDAYSHLAREDRYQPYEHRAEEDWVLVLFPETLTIRLFKTLEDVGQHYNWCTYRTNVYVKPEQLSAKHGTLGLMTLGERLGLTELRGLAPLAIAKLIWNKCQAVGDRVAKPPQAVAQRELYRVRVDLLKDLTLFKDLPKQAQVVAKGLADEEKTSYTKEELESFARQLVISGRLKTKQDASRIVYYYLPALADLEVVSYPGRRAKGGGDEEDEAETLNLL